jgi:hypothetical protein
LFRHGNTNLKFQYMGGNGSRTEVHVYPGNWYEEWRSQLIFKNALGTSFKKKSTRSSRPWVQSPELQTMLSGPCFIHNGDLELLGKRHR